MNHQDDEYGEIADGEGPGEPDLESEAQEASQPSLEEGRPRLILIKPIEREAETDPDDDPPGWPDF